MAKGKRPTTADIPPERLAEIIRDARSGINWAAELGYGPACRCGLKQNRMSEDDGTCPRHPNSVVSPES